jgi:cellulose synthase/poly-beta-1,6-N-acetylglucosamine synthase-like glycosyltransferase
VSLSSHPGLDLLAVVFAAYALVQAVLLYLFGRETVRCFRNRLRQTAPGWSPRIQVFIPCKGLDLKFADTIRNLCRQDYPNYCVTFVVESRDDPAYARLRQLLEKENGVPVEIVVAGLAADCGQKVHNLLAATALLKDDVEVLAFADSDAVPGPDWLQRLIFELDKPQVGAVTGYRWFVPEGKSWPSAVLSALNTCVTFGMTCRWLNHVWGGSWAIRREDFQRALKAGVWHNTVSDDLPVGSYLRTRKLQIRFQPACLVASPLRATWRGLIEFARRQFVITRIHDPRVFWLGLAAFFFGALSFWGGLAVSTWLLTLGHGTGWLAVGATVASYLLSVGRLTTRYRVLAGAFGRRAGMRRTALLDILAHPVLNALGFLLMSSAVFGRCITWRQTVYRLNGPHQTRIIFRESAGAA